MKRIEELNELIVRMFKKWIEVYKPGNCCYHTSGGDLTAEQILQQIAEKTAWGTELRTIIKLKYISVRSRISTESEKEKFMYSFIDETMNKLRTLSTPS